MSVPTREQNEQERQRRRQRITSFLQSVLGGGNAVAPTAVPGGGLVSPLMGALRNVPIKAAAAPAPTAREQRLRAAEAIQKIRSGSPQQGMMAPDTTPMQQAPQLGMLAPDNTPFQGAQSLGMPGQTPFAPQQTPSGEQMQGEPPPIGAPPGSPTPLPVSGPPPEVPTQQPAAATQQPQPGLQPQQMNVPMPDVDNESQQMLTLLANVMQNGQMKPFMFGPTNGIASPDMLRDILAGKNISGGPVHRDTNYAEARQRLIGHLEALSKEPVTTIAPGPEANRQAQAAPAMRTNNAQPAAAAPTPEEKEAAWATITTALRARGQDPDKMGLDKEEILRGYFSAQGKK